MEEENKPTTTDTDEGNQPSTVNLVERVDIATKRLEEVEKRLDAKKAEYEQLLARNLISGQPLPTSLSASDKPPPCFPRRRDSLLSQGIHVSFPVEGSL